MNNDKIELSKLTFHHVGLIVANLKESMAHYAVLFGDQSLTELMYIPSQNINVCFVNVGNGTYIELVEPASETSVVYNLLKKHVSYYHVCYRIADIISTVAKLEELYYKPFDYFISEAFPNKKCVFLYTPEGHLMELIEE